MVAIGLAAALAPASLVIIACFAAASLAGTVVHAANFDFAYSEHLVAISVILAGLLLLMAFDRSAGFGWPSRSSLDWSMATRLVKRYLGPIWT